MGSMRQNLCLGGPAGDPSASAFRRPDLCQDVRGCNAQGSSDVDELDDVDTPLAILVLGDEGLRLPQGGRDRSLGHALCLAGVGEQGLELPLSWCAQGFRHMEAGSGKDESRSTNPILGLSHFRILTDFPRKRDGVPCA